MAVKKVIFPIILLSSYLSIFTIFINNERFRRNILKHDYIRLPQAYCTENPPFLVLLVTTTEDQKELRNAIRQSWGKEQLIHGKRVVTFFLLGTSSTPSANREFFVLELNYYKDIIQKDFRDSYYNLTYKTLMGLEWISHHCPQARYIMKTDSDVFVNTHYLVELILLKNQMSNLFTGFLKLNETPIRDVQSKWYISESEYGGDKYPPFCSGTGYLFSVDVAQRIYKISSSVPFFKLEDVYIGMCLDKLNITLQELHQETVFFPDDRPPFSVCTYRKLVTLHEVKPQEMTLYWDSLLRAQDKDC